MELYGFFRSSTSYRLRIALNLKGLSYEAHPVSLPNMEHRADSFLAVNPQGLVPALVDEGRIFTQSLAMIEYLDETHPEPPLIPANPIDRAYVRAAAQIIACEIHPLNNVRVLKYLQSRWKLSDANRDEWYAHWIAEGFRGLEAYLAREKKFGHFVFGDNPGLADICLVPQVFNAERFDCDLSAYPICVAIHRNCIELESFERAQPKYQVDAF